MLTSFGCLQTQQLKLSGFLISNFFLITNLIHFLELSNHNSTPCLKKTVQICFCHNFVKFPLILIIFDRKVTKSLCHVSAENYQNWWKFDEVLTYTNLHSFFETRCTLIFIDFGILILIRSNFLLYCFGAFWRILGAFCAVL